MFHIANVEEACAWYSQLLSIEPVCFHQADSKVPFGKAGVVTYWRVENFDQAVARAEEMGATIYRGPMEIEDGSFVCQVADPFGNLFGVVG